jgi:hypothetical protein
MDKASLVDEVRQRLEVGNRRARSVVGVVFQEMQTALTEGQKITRLGSGLIDQVKDGSRTVLGLIPSASWTETAQVWAAATDRPTDKPTGQAAVAAAPTEPAGDGTEEG